MRRQEEGEDGGDGRGWCYSQTFQGPLRASVRETPDTEFPKAGAIAEAMGVGCPSCLQTLPSFYSTQSGQEGLTVGLMQTEYCLHPAKAALDPLTHTHQQGSRHKLLAVPTPSPQSTHGPPRLLIISLANASHSTVYCLHCFGLCIIYTVN